MESRQQKEIENRNPMLARFEDELSKLSSVIQTCQQDYIPNQMPH